MASTLFSTGCFYKIVSALDKKGEMVLDASQDPKELNKSILYKWNKGSNQQFAIRQYPKGSRKFAFFNARNNMVLMPQNEGTSKGDRIVLGIPRKQQKQLWTLTRVQNKDLTNNKDYFFITSHCGMTLDVTNQACDNGAAIIQWNQNHGHLNQIWSIQEVKN